MIPLWKLSCLIYDEAFTFTHDREQKIFIRGLKVNGKWLIDMRVSMFGRFAWGVNKLPINVTGNSDAAIRYLINLVVISLSEKGIVEGQRSLLQAYLE